MSYQNIPKSIKSLTLDANAQNVDLTPLLPMSPRGFLRVTGAGPTGASNFANIEVNGVASTGHSQQFSAAGAWAAAANGPLAGFAAGVSQFDFVVDARAGSVRAITGRCETNNTGRTHYTGGWDNTNTAVLTGLRILGAAANLFSAGFRFTVEEI